MHVIVGLGNPGQPYENTRHNMGFDVIGEWSAMLGVRLRIGRFGSRHARAMVEGAHILLVCPLSFMNRSGEVVRAWTDYSRVSPDRTLVIHDDLDLPTGRIKVAKSGGSGGHRGIASIISCLGTADFARIKVGIGRPRYGEPMEDYVLSRCYEDERDVLKVATRQAVQAAACFVLEGVESAMNRFNRKIQQKEEETRVCRD